LCACSLLLQPLDVSFSLKEKALTWSFDLLGSRACLCSCSLLLDLQTFPSCSKIISIWDVDLRGQGDVFVFLFSSLGIFNRLSSLLEENVLIFKAFLSERESFMWGSVSLGSDSSSPLEWIFLLGGNGSFHLRIPQWEGGDKGLFIDKPSLFTWG